MRVDAFNNVNLTLVRPVRTNKPESRPCTLWLISRMTGGRVRNGGRNILGEGLSRATYTTSGHMLDVNDEQTCVVRFLTGETDTLTTGTGDCVVHIHTHVNGSGIGLDERGLLSC